MIVVSGSRSWTDKETIRELLLEINPDSVLQGGCSTGADVLTVAVCREEGIECLEMKGFWARYGAYGGHARNSAMLDLKPERVLCFWDQSSKGTKGMIETCKQRGIYCLVITDG